MESPPQGAAKRSSHLQRPAWQQFHRYLKEQGLNLCKPISLSSHNQMAYTGCRWYQMIEDRCNAITFFFQIPLLSFGLLAIHVHCLSDSFLQNHSSVTATSTVIMANCSNICMRALMQYTRTAPSMKYFQIIISRHLPRSTGVHPRLGVLRETEPFQEA